MSEVHDERFPAEAIREGGSELVLPGVLDADPSTLTAPRFAGSGGLDASSKRVYDIRGVGMGCAPFPKGECATESSVAACESGNGTNPAAYDLQAENGGRLQINKATWERFFLEGYGWTWSEIVFDDQRNREAAHIIWLRAGDSWSPWSCKP